MITIDGKYRLREFGLYIEEGHNHPAISNFENKTLAIPGMPGVWDFGTELREKPFILPIATTGIERAKMQQRLNALVAFLCDEYGKPRNVKLVFDYEPDKFYITKLSEQITPDMIKPFTRFELKFVAMDPYKYSNELSEDVTWGSETITFEYSYLLGHEGLGGSVKVTGPQTIELDVEGLAVQPVFEINGTANNLKISANGHSFTLPNFANTKWTIDFEKYLVYRNGEETMIEIREFYLMPGRNKIVITGNNINIDMRIKFRDKFN